MSATASVSTPVMSSMLGPRRQQSGDRPDTIPRTTSTASRTASSTVPHRSNSTAHSSNPPPSASRQAAHLANVARHDHEQTNLAQQGISSQRNSLSDRRSPERTSQQERPRSTQRTSSRTARSQYVAEPSTAEGHGSPATRPEHNTQGVPRRRTTITAQTGEWSLGKTIGAGSMGKVKVGKHLKTGEQVRSMKLRFMTIY